MIKEYQKVTTIKAEQFDGSKEMINKYDMDVDGIGCCAIRSLEEHFKLSKGDWIATGVNGEHWVIRDDVFKKTYAEVVSKGILYYSKRMNTRDKLVKFFVESNLHVDSEKIAAQIMDLFDENERIIIDDPELGKWIGSAPGPKDSILSQRIADIFPKENNS